jgi:hypothetical protein
MNRIVREHYPVKQLPEDLRQGLDLAGSVRVVVEDRSAPSRDVLIQSLRDARNRPPAGDDPVERIRRLRDEWED